MCEVPPPATSGRATGHRFEPPGTKVTKNSTLGRETVAPMHHQAQLITTVSRKIFSPLPPARHDSSIRGSRASKVKHRVTCGNPEPTRGHNPMFPNRNRASVPLHSSQHQDAAGGTTQSAPAKRSHNVQVENLLHQDWSWANQYVEVTGWVDCFWKPRAI